MKKARTSIAYQLSRRPRPRPLTRPCTRPLASAATAATEPPVRLALLGCGGVAEAHLTAAVSSRI